MNKICYRFYFSFLQPQERFLNRMAAAGWRLVRTGKLQYEFEPCAPGEWEYRVEFVAALSWADNQDYAEFLRGLGYDVFHKNVNLNWSVGKVQWRPYGKGLGQVATSPGAINKELLLVGKQRDGKPFQLHTTWADRARQQADFRNAWLALGLLLAVLMLCTAVPVQAFATEANITEPEANTEILPEDMKAVQEPQENPEEPENTEIPEESE